MKSEFRHAIRIQTGGEVNDRTGKLEYEQAGFRQSDPSADALGNLCGGHCH
jgi:hypothetical protein